LFGVALLLEQEQRYALKYRCLVVQHICIAMVEHLIRRSIDSLIERLDMQRKQKHQIDLPQLLGLLPE